MTTGPSILSLLALGLLAACTTDLDAGGNPGTAGASGSSPGASGTSPGASGSTAQAGYPSAGAGGTFSGASGSTSQAGNGGSPGEAGAGGSVGGSPGEAGAPGSSGQPGIGGMSAAGLGGGDAGPGGTAGSGGVVTSKSVTISFGVDAFSLDANKQTFSHDNSAWAHATTEADSSFTSCVSTQYSGGCQLLTCPLPYPDNPVTLDMGDILITGAKVSPLALVRAPNSTGYNVLVPPQGTILPKTQPIVSGGEKITITGGGGVVPAFSLSGQVPSPIHIGGLPIPTGPNNVGDVDTSQDQTLSLLNSSVGDLYTVIVVQNNTQISQLLCLTPANAPSQVIPAAGLSKLKEVSADGAYMVSVVERRSTKQDDWVLSTFLSNIVKTENDEPYPIVNVKLK